MKALVVDDDPAARYLLKRVLTRDFNYAVVEAEDGLEALSLLEQHHFSVVLMDVRMPLMDGIETLQQIRNSSKHAGLHVVLTTSQKEEAIVRSAVALGVSDYLLKTSDTPVFLGRLSRALKSRPTTDQSGARPASSQAAAPIGQDGVLMIIDGDADFRHFFSTVFQTKCKTQEAKTVAQALKLCQGQMPTVVFIGDDVGIMTRESFVKKAREDTRMATAKFVAVVAKSQVADANPNGLYDLVVARSFVPDVFFRQVSHLFEAETFLKRFVEAHPSSRLSLITATEQVFGMMIAEEVAAAVSPAPLLSSGETAAGVCLPLQVPSDGVTLTLSLRASAATSRLVTARMIGAEPADVPDEDANCGLLEIANVIGGRLQNNLNEHGLPTQIGLPRALDATEASETWDRPDTLVLTFAFEQGTPTFEVALQVKPT